MELRIGDMYILSRPRKLQTLEVIYEPHLVELISIEDTKMVLLKNYSGARRLYSSLSFKEVNDATSVEYLQKNGQRLDPEIGKLLYA